VLGLGPATRIYLGADPVDMRKGFEGLYGLVRDVLGQDPLSGHLFLFTNRSRSRVKALFWDGSGLSVCAKRLEKSRFRWPACSHEAGIRRRRNWRCCSAGSILAEATPRRGWYRKEPTA
jgi:transposase